MTQGSMNASKVMPADQAVGMVASGQTLAVGGAGGVQEPDLLIRSLVEKYKAEGLPLGITEFHPIRCGELEGRGTSLFGIAGLVKRMIGGSFWPVGVPELIRRIHDNEMEAYNLPIGVMYALLEAAAAGRPGVVTSIGLGTFVDPRQDGGALNQSSRSKLVEVVNIAEAEYLFYRSVPIDVAFIRATTADELGNLTFEEEPALCGTLLLAQAAKATGGKVVAQVKNIATGRRLDPRNVKVPGILVDAVVVHPEQEQTTNVIYDPTLVGAELLPLDRVPRRPFDDNKVAMRRAFLEATPGNVLAIGFGVPGFLPAVAVEEEVLDKLTFTIEHGVVGGINGYACGGRTFPVSHNPESIIDAADQLRLYAGGKGVDCAFLGIGEVDRHGNVNVSRFGDRIPGCGGFIEMTQSIQKIVFCTVLGNKGRRKFVSDVQQVTFNADRARASGQKILYVTEMAVFSMAAQGIELIEIAPGLDPHRDVIDKLGCEVRISSELKPMPDICFSQEKMGLNNLWSNINA